MATSKRTTSDGLPIFDSVAATEDGLPVFKKKVSSDGGSTDSNTKLTNFLQTTRPKGTPVEQPTLEKTLNDYSAAHQQSKNASLGYDVAFVPKGANGGEIISNKEKAEDDELNTAAENTFNKTIGKGAYTKVDSANYVNQLKEGVKRGDLGIVPDAKGNNVIKNTGGFFESFKAASDLAYAQDIENKYLRSISKDEAISYLNRIADKPETGLVKEMPVAPDNNFGSIGQVGGGQSQLIGKTIIGGMLGAETGLTGGASTAGFLAIANDLANAGYSQALKKNYNELKKEGLSDSDAFDKATHAALTGEAVSLGQGILLSGEIPLKAKAASETNLIGAMKPNQSLATEGYLNSLKHTAKSAPKVVGSAGVGSVINDIQTNAIANGNPIDAKQMWEHSKEHMTQMLAFHSAVGGLSAIASGQKTIVPSYVRPQMENVVASADRNQVTQILQDGEQKGTYPPGTTQKVLATLSKFDEKKAIVAPFKISEEAKAAIAGKLVQKQKLLDEKATLKPNENAFPERVNEIDKEISGIDGEINKLYNAKDIFEKETDTNTGYKNYQPKTFEELKPQEKDGIIVPTDYGKAEVVEKGEGENKTYSPKAYYVEQQGALGIRKNIPIEGEKFTDKDKAQAAADNALKQHYYENGLHENAKPDKKIETEKNKEIPKQAGDGSTQSELNATDESSKKQENVGEDIQPQQGKVNVGQDMGGEKMPNVDEVYNILENEESRQGGSWTDNEYGDARFENEEQARKYAEEVHGFLNSLEDEKGNIPVYRAVAADDVDLTPYGIGESWSFDIDAAKEFGRHLGIPTSKIKIISGEVPAENVDWETAIRNYHNFSDLHSGESEFELPIPSNRKINNVHVEDFKTAKSIEKKSTPTENLKPIEENKGITDKEHRTNIEDTFRKQFKDKGVSDEHIDGALALMNARAKSAVSNGEVKSADEWYRRIADVKSGEFESAETPKQYQLPDGRKVMGMNQPEVVNGFYSPLEKTIGETKFDKLPAKQWLDKFATGEEAKWTGLNDWLKQQTGTVSKADIQKFLKDNRIEVVEVVKGKNEGKQYGLFTEDGTYLSVHNNKEDAQKIADIYGGGHYVKEVTGEGYVDKNSTKFEKYQLEGQKENYKEVLVTMPSRGAKFGLPENLQDSYNTVKYAERTYGKESEEYKNARRAFGRSALDEGMSNQDVLDFLKSGDFEKTDFRSTHFDEPNILVHLRMNTRTDAEGNKVLFLEEVQSDWGQKGKKEGFANKDEKFNARKTYDGYWEITGDNGRFVGNVMPDEASTAQEAVSVVNNRISQNQSHKFRQGTPEAPFVTDTNAWTKLGLKVALKEAVKQGADKIAWTTGEQQNERYDLSKSVDSVAYRKNEDGTYHIMAVKGDDRVLDERSVAENKIEDYVGKEVAKRIINEEGEEAKAFQGNKTITLKELTGEQLKVGGKGMKGFYGEPKENKLGIVGEVAKKLFKQEPKETKIITQTDAPTSSMFKEGDAYIVEYYDMYGKKEKIFDSEKNASSFLDSLVEKTLSTQHSIDITPELKKQVEQGQPLFQKDAEGKAKGALETLKDGRVVIHALDSPDFSTMAHEIGHIFEKDLTEAEQKIVKDFGGSEPFARGFERYLRDGKAPTEQLKALFDKFKTWLTNIYKSIKGTPLEKKLSPEVKQIFDRLLTEKEKSEKTGISVVEDKGSISKGAFHENVLNMAEGMKDSNFDWRLTIPEMSQKEREQAVKDIRAGKDSKPAQKLQAFINDAYDRDVITLNRGRGNQAQTVEFPLKEWFREPLTHEELNHAEKLDDNATRIINDEGITSENIDNLKHLFNGFPYDKEDFEQVKNYLSGQDKSNAENQSVGTKSEAEKEIPKVEEQQPKPTEKDLGNKARDYASKLRTGDANVLPSWLRADLPKGTQKGGISINEAFANALDAFAEAHDKFKDFTKAIEAGFKHLKDWFEENGVDYDEKELKENFKAQMQGESGEQRTSGGSHNSLNKVAERLGLEKPKRGEVLTPEQYTKRGKLLYDNGADYEKMAEEFEDDGKINADMVGVAKARMDDLADIADKVRKQFGKDSPEFEKAQQEYKDWRDNTMKPMGTKFGELGRTLQGETDLDTGSFIAVKSSVEDETGKPINAAQEKKIQELTDQNQKLESEAKQAEAKLISETDKAFKSGVEEGKKLSKTDKAKKIADKLRENAKLHKPGSFSAATPASLVWDSAIEVVAKGIEAGGKIADVIEDGLNHIRNSDWYKSLSDDKKQNAEADFKQWNNDNTNSTELEDMQARFLGKTGNKFTTDEAKTIWQYAKDNYLDKGVSYRDMISQVQNDLGLSWRQVNEAISSPKTKRISDEMWKKQAQYRRGQNVTKTWVEDQNRSKAIKVLKKITGAFRGSAVFGHGGIFVGTHAAPTLFQPTTWNKVIPAFIRGWKFAYGSEAAYERRMEELKNSKNYTLAQRSGLKNNPDRLNVEEYQNSQKFLGKLGHAGERGFNAIKVLRQDLFDYHYNKLSAAEKQDPETAKSIAKLVNNATGASNLNIPKAVNELTFAGGMEAARWGKLTTNPVKATAIALRAIYEPSKVSTADKVFAKVWASRVGQQLATYTGALLANAAIQNTLNPKNPVNLTNPNKPDWLKFKFGDLTIDPTSGMRGVANFIYGLGKIPFETKKQLHGDNVLQAAGKQTFGYGRGKLAPAYSTLIDLYTKTDYYGNPLPYNNEKPTAGKHKLTWGEYAWQKAPLPAAEAAHVMYQSAIDHGADRTQLNHVLDGIVSGAISGSTGFRVGEYNAEEAKHSPFTEEDLKDPTFKYYIDKGLELPNTSLNSETVPGTDNKIADYPKEIQDKYIIEHTKALKAELKEIKADRTVYVTKNKTLKGDIVVHVDINVPDNDNYKEVNIDNLSKEELAQLLSIAQSLATKEAKRTVFEDNK
jgi:hypothetical protein